MVRRSNEMYGRIDGTSFHPWTFKPSIKRISMNWDATNINALSNEICSISDTEINRLGRWVIAGQALLISRNANREAGTLVLRMPQDLSKASPLSTFRLLMRGLEETLKISFFSKIDQEPKGDSNDLRGLDWERASSGVKRRMES